MTEVKGSNRAPPSMLARKGRADLIELTRLNEKKIILNAELIESIESTPDTVLTLVTGKKFIVKEGCQEVKNLVLSYKRDVAVNWSVKLMNEGKNDS